MRKLAALACPFVLLLLFGCDSTGTESSGGTAPPTTTTTTSPPSEPSTPGTVGQVDRAAMNQDAKEAVQAIGAYWRTNFPEAFNQAYRPPRVAGGYTGTDGPPCGGEPSVPFNAYYCQPGDYLAWDEDLMAAGYNQIGDAWVYLIIAHEWGHAIQARLNDDLVSVQAELQADCLAGASLEGAAKQGLITIEPGDPEELAKTLAAVADDYPWTKQSDHGDVQERISAFRTGVTGGIPACTT
ncbi:hypothetical protein FB561_1126 [Kribbella amoyensis]|uniref:Metalloprotease n=1 Tax=Kribbella amoyensis TaxID=996641 RepID=A0A561BMH6_9ACTN|nr:neutral zinc metallopeptidase [Kribbella amoyensis]TWD80054.1 hypothetical protein FB561_1126 [Kribbella amoyensis]